MQAQTNLQSSCIGKGNIRALAKLTLSICSTGEVLFSCSSCRVQSTGPQLRCYCSEILFPTHIYERQSTLSHLADCKAECCRAMRNSWPKVQTHSLFLWRKKTQPNYYGGRHSPTTADRIPSLCPLFLTSVLPKYSVPHSPYCICFCMY